MLGRSQWTRLGSSCRLGTRGDRKEGEDHVWGRCSDESHLSLIPSRLKVTSASILQLQLQPSADGQEMMVKIPVDMVAGFNT